MLAALGELDRYRTSMTVLGCRFRRRHLVLLSIIVLLVAFGLIWWFQRNHAKQLENTVSKQAKRIEELEVEKKPPPTPHPKDPKYLLELARSQLEELSRDSPTNVIAWLDDKRRDPGINSAAVDLCQKWYVEIDSRRNWTLNKSKDFFCRKSEQPTNTQRLFSKNWYFVVKTLDENDRVLKTFSGNPAESINPVQFDWRIGQRINVKLYVDNNTPWFGHDTLLLDQTYRELLAIWQLHKAGFRYQDEKVVIEFKIPELDEIPRPNAIRIPTLE